MLSRKHGGIEMIRNIFYMAVLFGGDLFVRCAIQSNPNKFPKYYWLGVAVVFGIKLLRKVK